jgi:uncharacterized BrkB/YihY/UPF0761 family membrane protein
MNIKRFANIAVIALVTFFAGVNGVLAQSYYDYEYYPAPDPVPLTSSEALGFGVFTLVIICVVFLLSIVLPLILAVVVYNDAKKNKIENAWVWALFVFFFNVIGLLVYYLAIKPNNKKTEN